jgi:hypothetical protein
VNIIRYMLSDEQEICTEPDTIYWRMYLRDTTKNTLVNIDLYFVARIDEGGVFKVYWMPEREAKIRVKAEVPEFTSGYAIEAARQVALRGQKITDLEVAADLFTALVEAGLKPTV